MEKLEIKSNNLMLSILLTKLKRQFKDLSMEEFCSPNRKFISFLLPFCSAEKQIIHNIMKITPLKTGGSKTYSFGFLSLNVVNISEADLNSTDTNSTVQIEVPQVWKV